MPNLVTRTLVLTAAYTGARIGELLGLDRRNVHLDTRAINVVPKVGALHEEGGDRWPGDPKTPASAREITLPPFLVEGLGILLAAHPYDTVFCGGDGDRMWRTTYVQHYWRPACDGRAERGWAPVLSGLRFHDLRHAHRTWMDEDLMPEVLKNRRLGHTMPDIAGVYSHDTEPMQPPLLAAPQRRWEGSGAHGPDLAAHNPQVSRFAFRVEQVLPYLEGVNGVVLAGPVLERGVNFAAGDALTIPLADGTTEGRCAGFPLIRWGQDRRHWISVAVAGVAHATVQLGGIASTPPTANA